MMPVASSPRSGANHQLQGIVKVVGILAVATTALFVASYCLVDGASIGSKSEIALCVLIAGLPLALYLALTKPFLFPLGLYVLLVPMDPFLQISPSFGTLTKLIAISVGAAFLFWLVRNHRYSKPDKVVFVWLALLVWMALSVMWALDPIDALQKLATYAQLIALYIVISLMPIGKSEYQTFLIAIAVCGIVGAAGCVYLYDSGYFVAKDIVQGTEATRLIVKYGDTSLEPDAFSAALLLPLAIITTWALQRRRALAKIALIVMALLIVGGIYVNGSRGAELALAVMVAYMIARGRFKGPLTTVAIVALLVSFVMPNSPWLRFGTALQTGGSGRLSIWKVGIEAFKHNWLLGGGVGNFPTAYDQSFITVYQRVYAYWHRAPHDMIIEFAVELGVIGLILLLSAWYLQLRSLSVIPKSSDLYDMRIAIEAAYVAVFVSALFVGLMDYKFTWLLFGLIAVTRSYALSASHAFVTVRHEFDPEHRTQNLLITPAREHYQTPQI
jgi:O-antigen ligase